MQTRRQSMVEVITNTSVGMVGSWLIAYTVLSLVQDKVWAVSITTLACTVWSLARGYLIRRAFAKVEIAPLTG